MSKLLNLINTEDNDNIPYVFDEKNFEIEDKNSVEFRIKQDFSSELLTAVFGKVINNL